MLFTNRPNAWDVSVHVAMKGCVAEPLHSGESLNPCLHSTLTQIVPLKIYIKIVTLLYAFCLLACGRSSRRFYGQSPSDGPSLKLHLKPHCYQQDVHLIQVDPG